MSKRRKSSNSNELPRMIEVHVENGFCGMVEVIDHGDGTVSFSVPLPDHIGRLLDQFYLHSSAEESAEAEAHDGAPTIH